MMTIQDERLNSILDASGTRDEPPPIAWMPRASRVMTVLFWHGPLSIKEITQLAAINSANAYLVLEELKADGAVVRQGPRRNYRFDVAGR